MLLSVTDLNTYYGSSHVLQNVALHIEQGEIVCLLGRNGMGKSTTLKTIMGLIKPASGAILYHAKHLNNMPPHCIARLGIGYVPEERRIFSTLTVLENLLMGIKRTRNAPSSGQDRWTLERVYKHFPILKDRSHHKGSQLSGGEQQMLTIGRALMGNPDLLLVDEPMEGLAPIVVEEVRNILREINQAGITILLVEHNLRVAMSLADRIYLMGKAHIAYEGMPDELASKPEIIATYLEV